VTVLQTCLLEMSCSNLGGSQTLMAEFFHSFPQSLQANALVVPQLHHDPFSPSRFSSSFTNRPIQVIVMLLHNYNLYCLCFEDFTVSIF
jgi:hypothetical protein